MNKELFLILAKRFFTSVIVLLMLLSLIFFLLRISPGDPMQKYISPELSPQLNEQVRTSFNLNKPVFEQYIAFIGNLLCGDFGISYEYKESVIKVILEFLPFTIIFASLSFLIQILLGSWTAIHTFKNKNGLIDKIISRTALALYSIPTFVLAVILIFIFCVKFDLFPSADLTSLDFNRYGFFNKLLDYALHLVLPLITLSLGGIVIYYKYLRDNLDSISQKPFVKYLAANGTDKIVILKKHILPNAAGPMISVAGIELGILFGGALITEVIFSLPGMGRLTMLAIQVRDYPMVIGCTFIAGLLIIITNLIADLIKVKIDKRLLRGVLE